MAPTMSVAASAQLPWRHDGATPPQEWLRLLATELLESKVSAEWLAGEWRSAAQDCSVPLVCTTGDLRTRHEKYPDAFRSTISRLGGRIATALKDKVEFEWEDFTQTLLERAEAELTARLAPPPPEPEMDAGEGGAEDPAKPTATEEPRVKEEVDAVFTSHAEAQTASLIAVTTEELVQLARKGTLGRDGGLVANGWRPTLVAAGEVRKYKQDAAPRGKHGGMKKARGEGDADEQFDENYDDSQEEEEDSSDDDAARTSPPATAKRRQAKGPKQRLQETLGQRAAFTCALCAMERPLQSTKAMTAHRNGPKSCVRSSAGRRNGSIQALSSEGFLFFSEPPAAAQPSGRGGRGAILSGRGRGGGNRGGGRGKKNAASKKSAADQAKLVAFLLNKYGPGASGLAAAEAVATSTDEEVVCEGEKTREERDAELRGEAVLLDE